MEKLVIVNRDITDRKRAEEQLAHYALHDAMTGLPNRRLFLDRLQRCFAEAQREPVFRYADLRSPRNFSISARTTEISSSFETTEPRTSSVI
jgi:GGDEF domain-containing protein